MIKNYVLLVKRFSWIYRSFRLARAGDFKINYFAYYINMLLRFFFVEDHGHGDSNIYGYCLP